YLFIGAEKLTLDLVERSIAAIDEECRIFNMYGPTETTIIATTLEINRENIGKYKTLSNVPIGEATGNSQLFILDKYLKPVPFQVGGELYIGGEGVSRGYLNKPELTAERFIKASWQSAVGSRQEEKAKKTKEQNEKEEETAHRNNQSPLTNNYFYRTGDRVRWFPDKTLEFLERLDCQVKVRGFRIELGEIENHLLTHNNITKAVVVAKDDENGETYLCAYYVANPLTQGRLHGDGTEAADIRNHLSKTLPDYMIPVYFVPINTIPLNPNGKVDLKALPEPETAMVDFERAAPRDKLERKLVEIWSDVLNVDKESIGIDDSFFQLGGHSLKATRLVSKSHKELNVNIPLTEFFKIPTIRALADYVKKQEEVEFPPIEAAEKKNVYPASSTQKRLYILQQRDDDNIVYNIPAALELIGAVDTARLENTFNLLIKRHESLRTTFEIVDGETVQKINDYEGFALEYYDAGEKEGSRDDIIKNFIRPFELSRKFLLRVGLVKTNPPLTTLTAGELIPHLLLIDMHHIIADGTSIGILASELIALYEGKTLTPLRIQYKDYTRWLAAKQRSEAWKKQEAYWLELYREETPVVDLPYDYNRLRFPTHAGKQTEFRLDTETANALKTFAMER
ncbi:MAG: AMP-binding protein, partial [bacterium]|nr:AMP-binding protein [bacterium]